MTDPAKSTYLTSRMHSHSLRVLFLCTRNAARSQLAEAILTRKGGANFVVGSAGAEPATTIHPLTIEALAEMGIAWTGRTPKSIDDVSGKPWDLVITVCDRAKEACTTLPGRPVFAHWGLPDPAAIEGTDAQKRQAFIETAHFLSRRIDLLLALPFEKLEQHALRERVENIARVITKPGDLDSPESAPKHARIALISDIHSNLPALEAVLEEIAGERGMTATYHLGDLVGYAPWPNEVVALLRGFRIPGIAGNYDSTVAMDYKHCGCKYEDAHQEELSHLSYAWTREATRPETKRFLGELPFRLDVRPFGGHAPGPTLILVHGTPTLNTVYWTEDRPDAFCTKMAELAGASRGDVIAFGHTHKPWHRVVDGVHFVNTGSVGRPKDGDWRAGFVILEFPSASEVRVEFRRTAYDVERAAQGIEHSTLPAEFADYLRTGGRLAVHSEFAST